MKNTNFTFRCYSNFTKTLGEFDAVVECNELAVRRFTALLKRSNDKEKCISKLSDKYGVRVNTINLDIFDTRISQWYILSVYQQAEDFFSEFKKEHPQGEQWTDKRKDESQLDYLIKVLNIKKDQIDLKGKGIRCEIFEYYRLIRNRFMHPNAGDNLLKQALRKIKDHKINEFSRLNAPNEYNEIKFDDFILYARVAKDIFKDICRLSKPDDWDIVKMLLKREKDPEVKLKRLRRLSNNPEQLKKRLQKLLKSQYNLQEDEVECIIEELLKSELLAQR